MSDLVGKPEDRFSHDVAPIMEDKQTFTFTYHQLLILIDLLTDLLKDRQLIETAGKVEHRL